MQVITTHTGTDFDALASMVAARKLYPQAKICFPGSLSGEVKDFIRLYRDVIQDTSPEEIDLKDIDELILVDTRWINRIGIFSQLIEKKDISIHIYDHHPPHPKDIEGDWGVCREVGATTSILVHLIRKRNIPLPALEATLFLLGIYEDTGSLSFSSTNSLDLNSAAYLLKQGANLEFICGFLNRDLTPKQSQLFQKLLENLCPMIINGVEIVITTARINEYIGGLSLPLHKLIDLRNLDVVFAIIETKDRIYVIARSRNLGVNVGQILSFLGGGGHDLAASAVIRESTLEQIKKKLCSYLKEHIKPLLSVRDIISQSSRTISPLTEVEEALEMMEEYGVEVLPVVQEGKILGIISREKVKNIVAHNSGKSLLKNYFSPKFVSIPPFFSLKKAQQVMIEKESAQLLVEEEGKLFGVLSSFDLLRAFHGETKTPEKGVPKANVQTLLREMMPPKIFRTLQQAGKTARDLGYKAYLVGGVVRDLLLGIENLDVDLVIEGNGIFFASHFADQLGAKCSSHEEFGTAALILPDGFKFDIAMARREYYPRPGALPQVQPSSLREDLSRRDFTVNSMAIELNPPSFGEIIDFFGGQRDLQERKVRVLHTESFREDPTRIFRAVRFEQRYGFALEQSTEALIKKAVCTDALEDLSRERVREEFIHILEEDRPERSLRRLQELGILKKIHPEISLKDRQEEILDRLIDVFAFFEILSGKKGKRWLVRLTVLLENLNQEQREDFCRKYHFNKEDREAILKTGEKVDFILNKLSSSSYLPPSSIYGFLHPLPQQVLLLALAKAEKDRTKKRINLYLTRLKNVKISIDGHDLKNVGYRPSPRFNKILEDVQKARLDDKVKTKEEEIAYIKANFPLGEE